MLIARALTELNAGLADLRRGGKAVALVATMGALHAGHRALVDAAAASGARIAVSIFVNPTQFGPADDFARYPRDDAGDLEKLRAWGCDLVWLPDVAIMYPPGDATTVVPAGPAERWEGISRPGHFRGMATVVAKLFGQIRPETSFFGEKDWQQLQVVRRMVTDLHLGVTIVPVPTVRESDGLALSSRNQLLRPDARARAPLLHATMQQTAAAVRAGRPTEDCLREGRTALSAGGFELDYLALVDGPTLEPLDAPAPGARLIAAARLGAVRLIDNIPLT